MSPPSPARSGVPTRTRFWALGIPATGLALVCGFFAYVLALAGPGPAVSIENGFVLFGPYFLCGLMLLLANGVLAARLYAVLIVAAGLITGVLVGWELTAGVVRGGGPPPMLARVFLGAFVLVGQYLAAGFGVLVAWIYWTATPWSPGPRPTQEERDYAG